MDTNSNHDKFTGQTIILTVDDIRELQAIAMTLDQLAGLFTGFAKTIRQLTGEETEVPKS